MLETTLIAGLGMAALATSALTPMQHFGYLMMATLALALVGDLIVLPAILVGPVGSFFRRAEQAEPQKTKRDAAALRTPAPHFVTPPAVADRATGDGARPDNAAVPPPRGRTGVTADARHEAAQGPHAALHARLQELRRAAGGDPGQEPT